MHCPQPVRPLIERWSVDRDHLREITVADVEVALERLRGHQRRNAITALRSLFRFAKKHGHVFSDLTTRPTRGQVETSLLPMTEAQIRAVEAVAVSPAQRLVVALAAVHAARAGAIRRLRLGDIDMPNRRITIDGHAQRLGELPYRALRAWLEHRRRSWPLTVNPHVLISRSSALGTDPISHYCLKRHLLLRGVQLEHIRADRVLCEALRVGPDPLHLALVFNLAHSTASRYTDLAQKLLTEQIEQAG
jgi:integrase